MKKLILFVFFCCTFAMSAMAQLNLQLHYDLGRALYNSLDGGRSLGDYHSRNV